MLKLICNEFGFDCNFVIKNNDKKIIANNFCKHLLDNHDQYYPIKEMLTLIDNQNNKDEKNYETHGTNKLFQGRRNYP